MADKEGGGMDWGAIIKVVGEVVNNIIGTSKENKAKKAADKSAAESEASSVIPDGYYMGQDGVLWANNSPAQTLASIKKKATEFGGKLDLTLYEDAGTDNSGNKLYRAKKKAAPAPVSGVKSNNILGDIIGNIIGGSSGSDGNLPKTPSPTLNVLKYVPALVLLGGLGYGGYWLYKKYKK